MARVAEHSTAFKEMPALELKADLILEVLKAAIRNNRFVPEQRAVQEKQRKSICSAHSNVGAWRVLDRLESSASGFAGSTMPSDRLATHRSQTGHHEPETAVAVETIRRDRLEGLGSANGRISSRAD